MVDVIMPLQKREKKPGAKETKRANRYAANVPCSGNEHNKPKGSGNKLFPTRSKGGEI